ncbi:chemotaxis protein CheW [Desulfotomaculum sp. 1211_IL3151]|uniref:chemotaxis protein CheW n=1 Tax=Desulfotomaculum sp. 1211_IL3151 TaxID=3084055 RepID=UPI002FDAD9F0
MKYLIFMIQGQRFAIKLAHVERVIRAVEVTPIPRGHNMMGLINIQGWITPVVNSYSLFKLAQREIDINDRFIIIQTEKRQVALIANEVAEVVEKDWHGVVDADKFLDRVALINGVLKLADGMILIVDPEELLSATEERLLDEYVNGSMNE